MPRTNAPRTPWLSLIPVSPWHERGGLFCYGCNTFSPMPEAMMEIRKWSKWVDTFGKQHRWCGTRIALDEVRRLWWYFEKRRWWGMSADALACYAAGEHGVLTAEPHDRDDLCAVERRRLIVPSALHEVMDVVLDGWRQRLAGGARDSLVGEAVAVFFLWPWWTPPEPHPLRPARKSEEG